MVGQGNSNFLEYNVSMNKIDEELKKGFTCINCGKWTNVNKYNDTVNKNHCPHCLWSKHVDDNIAGDRMSSCNSGMKPIGLTIKKPRVDKYGVEVKGEVMIIHECTKCEKISINRILGEDSQTEIMNVFEKGMAMDKEKKNRLKKIDIVVLSEEDREEVKKQIFGNTTVDNQTRWRTL